MVDTALTGARPAAARAAPARDLLRNLPEIALVGAAIGSVATILGVARHLSFFADEWVILLHPPVSLVDYLAPHNEHWSTGLLVVFDLLYRAFGTRTYLPYLVALMAFHVSTAAGLYVAVRDHAGRAGAAALAMLLLWLGCGWEDLYWAFQIGFVGSCAFGIWALGLLDRGHPRGAALFLVCSLAWSGVGLFFLAAAAAFAAIGRDPRALRWLIVPAGVYLAWFLGFGSAAAHVTRDPFTIDAIAQAVPFAVMGTVAAIGTVSALGAVGSVLLGTAYVVLVVAAFRRGSVPPLAIAPVAGVLAGFAIVGLVRAQMPDLWAASRYQYPAATLGLLSAGVLWPFVRGRSRTVGAEILLLAVAVNAVLLPLSVERWGGRARTATDYGCYPASRAVVPTATGTVEVDLPDALTCASEGARP